MDQASGASALGPRSVSHRPSLRPCAVSGSGLLKEVKHQVIISAYSDS